MAKNLDLRPQGPIDSNWKIMTKNKENVTGMKALALFTDDRNKEITNVKVLISFKIKKEYIRKYELYHLFYKLCTDHYYLFTIKLWWTTWIYLQIFK